MRISDWSSDVCSSDLFGMKDRGSLRENAFADLVLFDPDSVIDTATFTAPKTPARGIAEVWVNGVSSYVGGQDGRKQGVTGATAGRLVPRQAESRSAGGR